MARAKRKTKKKGGGIMARVRRMAGALALGGDVDDGTSSHLQEIKGFVFGGLALWLLISMGSYYRPDAAAEGVNWGGRLGWYLASWVFAAIGWSGYLLVFLGVTWGAVLVARKGVRWPLLRAFGALCFLASTAFLFELAFGARVGQSNSLPYGPGGYVAQSLVGTENPETGAAAPLIDTFGRPGLWILLVLATLVSFMLATEMAFLPALRSLRDWLGERRSEKQESAIVALLRWTGRTLAGLWRFLRGADIAEADAVRATAKPARATRAARGKKEPEPTPELFDEEEEDELEDEDEAEDEEPEEDEDWEEEEDEYEEYEEEEEEEPEPEERELAPVPAATTPNLPVGEPPRPPAGPWKFPPLDLLEEARAATGGTEGFVETQAKRLENALESFRVEATVVGAKVGPAVTLFELEVAQGTRMNKVTQLSQEIAAALRAKSVRIIAPIPGRSTVGIEVPNEERRLVRLSELVTQKAYDKKFMALPLFLGVDAEGGAVVEDLARMPHLLIAGTTGSGKSVCINSILASLLLTRSPHDVQLILVDPKMVELQLFSAVPHLMLPVVSDARQATNVLLWAVDKMEGRYELFQTAGVRNIKSYNELSEDELRDKMGEHWNDERTPRHVPYMVIVVDEMADLMMVSKKEAEHAITRLAQKSRAVGIHVIVATQRPSTDVITGVLKGNLPTRIAFQVASKVDSRVILDSMGAEKLLGQGDMLFTPPQSSQIRRVQGALVEDEEIQSIVDFLSQVAAPSFSQELVQTATGTSQPGSGGGGADADELWDEAVRVILKSKRGSASLLQRALGIGYTRASRLIDLMTAEGIVGEHKGSKAREVLLTLEDWESMHGAAMGQGAGDE